ncbi:hypothetical protein G6F46_015493 [Rhizopus delemar]|nr:hypothetical protein G6F46_015493 [Rhizopus delemar]
MPTLDAREVERDRMLEHRDWQLAAFIKNALAAVLPTKSRVRGEPGIAKRRRATTTPGRWRKRWRSS